MAKDSFINWDQLADMSKSPDYGNIIGMLTAPQKSYRDVAGAEVMPLLQPGVDPYMQQAINEIVRQGRESKARSIADVTTSAQARGLTGSSIESGDIAQTSYQQEMGQQGQITNLLAQDAAAKKQQMVQFLTQAYGMDFERANQISSTLAQVMGQELGRRTDIELARITGKAMRDSKPGWLESLAPTLISTGAHFIPGFGK